MLMMYTKYSTPQVKPSNYIFGDFDFLAEIDAMKSVLSGNKNTSAKQKKSKKFAFSEGFYFPKMQLLQRCIKCMVTSSS